MKTISNIIKLLTHFIWILLIIFWVTQFEFFVELTDKDLIMICTAILMGTLNTND